MVVRVPLLDRRIIEYALTLPDTRNRQGEKKQVLTVLYPPEFFGSLSFMDGKPHSATAVAEEATEIFILTREDFNHFMENHPLASFTIIHCIACSIASLVREMDQQYIDIVRFAYTG